eukprot:scaffold269920_cov18-Tisochrysis_lutea.AAC.1
MDVAWMLHSSGALRQAKKARKETNICMQLKHSPHQLQKERPRAKAPCIASTKGSIRRSQWGSEVLLAAA